MTKKYKVIPFTGEFYNAFSQPESNGSWFVWANSGNGKTTFVLMLCKELMKFEQILYNSLEEGAAMTMMLAFKKAGLASARRKILLVCETIEELIVRLDKPKSSPIVVLDSYQYTGLSFDKYRAFIKRYPKKLFIIISQADGKNPSGRTAKRVMYDASLKIWIEGHKAFSKGRYIGPNGGEFTIWEEAAKKYHG